MIDLRGRRKEKRKRGMLRVVLWIPLSVLIICGAAALGGLTFYWTMIFKARTETVKLENVVDMDVQEAVRKLTAEGFIVKVEGGTGKVIRMDPTAGTRVKRGRTIKLYTEQVRIKSIILPNFKGAWYKSVQDILRDVGVETIVQEVNEGTFKGIVVSTSPTPGSKVVSGDRVKLFVSSGIRINIPGPVEEEATTEAGPVEIIPPEVGAEVGKTPVTYDPLENVPSVSPSASEENSTPQVPSEEITPKTSTEDTNTLQGGQF
ncbi:PASTA domain-containing protein [Fervidobacterium thailandense]|uniref:PASTA domain-containing protein n=1 Tax=Fervidobacterium thailandense TaxID=1008305 RepID=A0A1E3G4P1_9BACT|nr:PASTA domain-containing protein [Fervidobacterium thailandense]ODN31100.1 hypothetical protein A4H02_02190 [Fervidobacterium thailandense]